MLDKKIYAYFGTRLRRILDGIPYNMDFSEIRLRLEKPLVYCVGNRLFYPDEHGIIMPKPCEKCAIVHETDIREVFEAICRYSVHSHLNEITEGFITLDGGHRAGLCGTAVINGGKITNIKNISSINLRIARQKINCAQELYNSFFADGKPINLLIAGAPASGKTTILRDLCRLLSYSMKVSLIDERNEIAAAYGGVPANNVGINTDVFSGYSKRTGIEAAVRVMSPEVIICDEAGGDEDYRAFEYAARCGVKIVAAIHADSERDLEAKLPQKSFFDAAVFLYGADKPCIIKKIVRNEAYAENSGSGGNRFCGGNDGKLFCGKPEQTA